MGIYLFLFTYDVFELFGCFFDFFSRLSDIFAELRKKVAPKKDQKNDGENKDFWPTDIFEHIFCNFNKRYLSLLADLNSLIAEEIPRISSGIFLVPKRATTTTAMMTISVVPIFSI